MAGELSTRRLYNLWYDFRAILAGYCNAKYPSGYMVSDWRCGLPAEHSGPHRFKNQVWSEGEAARFHPLPLRGYPYSRWETGEQPWPRKKIIVTSERKW